MNVGVSQGSTLAFILLPLFIYDLTPTSHWFHRFANDVTLQCFLFYSTTRCVADNIDHDRIVFSSSLGSDHGRISAWGLTNHVCLNASKTHLSFLLHSPICVILQFNSGSTSLRSTQSFVLSDSPVDYSLF